MADFASACIYLCLKNCLVLISVFVLCKKKESTRNLTSVYTDSKFVLKKPAAAQLFVEYNLTNAKIFFDLDHNPGCRRLSLVGKLR